MVRLREQIKIAHAVVFMTSRRVCNTFYVMYSVQWQTRTPRPRGRGRRTTVAESV